MEEEIPELKVPFFGSGRNSRNKESYGMYYYIVDITK